MDHLLTGVWAGGGGSPGWRAGGHDLGVVQGRSTANRGALATLLILVMAGRTGMGQGWRMEPLI